MLKPDSLPQDQETQSRRRFSLLKKAGAVVTLSSVVVLGVGGESTHEEPYVAHAASTPAISETPKLPNGTPNFNPILDPAKEVQYDLELDFNQSVSTIVDGPVYVGYAAHTKRPGVERLVVGAEVIPDKNGGLKVRPLYGEDKSIDFSPRQLQDGSASVELGGDFTLQASSNPISGEPEVSYGDNKRQPYLDTYGRH